MYHSLTDSIIFFERVFPSANMTVILGEKPILIDTGFGSDFNETTDLLNSINITPQELKMAANTHYHCDHVGGNHRLQTDFGVPIAAYYSEAKMVNARDAFACSAEWLCQPIEAYTVDHFLREGDEISTDRVNLQVVHTPGHSLGHISFYEPVSQILILGDVVHADDIAWLNNFREGVGALDRMIETLEKLLKLPVKQAVSGHGGIHENPHEIMRKAIQRYEKWAENPQKIAWHAMKRIFTYALMLTDGLAQDEVHGYLLTCPWFVDFSRVYFEAEPANFIAAFMQEIQRSGAGRWVDNKLYPSADFRPLPDDWYPSRKMPRHW